MTPWYFHATKWKTQNNHSFGIIPKYAGRIDTSNNKYMTADFPGLSKSGDVVYARSMDSKIIGYYANNRYLTLSLIVKDLFPHWQIKEEN